MHSNEDLYDFLQIQLEKESEININPDLFEKVQNGNMTSQMRYKLVNWMINVINDIKNISNKCKQISIYILDMFLSKVNIKELSEYLQLKKPTDCLQLLGSICIFVSVKLEENIYIQLKHVQKISGNQYSPEQILAAEKILYQALGFKLIIPTPGEFVRQISFLTNIDLKTESLHQIDLYIDEFFKYEYCLSFSPVEISMICMMYYFHQWELKQEEAIFIEFIQKSFQFANWEKISIGYETFQEDLFKLIQQYAKQKQTQDIASESTDISLSSSPQIECQSLGLIKTTSQKFEKIDEEKINLDQQFLQNIKTDKIQDSLIQKPNYCQ